MHNSYKAIDVRVVFTFLEIIRNSFKISGSLES